MTTNSLPPTRDRSTVENFSAFLPGDSVDFDSQQAWRNVFVRILTHRTIEDSIVVPAVAEPLVVWVLSGSAMVEERTQGGEWQACSVEEGSFFLTTTAVPYEMRWKTVDCETFQVMHLYLGLPILDAAIHDVFGSTKAPVRFREISGGEDALLSSLLGHLKAERVAASTSSVMFVQGVAHAVAVHLVRHYLDCDTPVVRSNALPAFKLRQVTQWMVEHLADTFNLATLSHIAGMSEYHFSRLFKRATGLAPSAYFMRLRIQRARELLTGTDMSIIDIGLAVGYSTASHFSHIFRREVGCTPSQYRRGD